VTCALFWFKTSQMTARAATKGLQMALARSLIILALTAAAGLTSCTPRGSGLLNLRATSTGPDEFAILPTKPLVLPKDFAALPEPTQGGTNLADPTPGLDAALALGGNAKSIKRAGVARGDQGLIAAAGRYGVAPDIRVSLAAEDKQFRKDNPGKLLERLFNVSTYFSAYEPMTLDRYGELARLRRLGIRTPAAPPETVE